MRREEGRRMAIKTRGRGRGEERITEGYWEKKHNNTKFREVRKKATPKIRKTRISSNAERKIQTKINNKKTKNNPT